MLTLYDKTLPVKLSCDASSYGVGAVLSHEFPDKTERPIAYASHTLSKSEKNYSQLDKEGLAIIFGLNKFRQYLFGRKFTLCTDNKALSYMFDRKAEIPTLAASRIARWTLKLAEYDYDIKFKPTHEHANADMLSRLPIKTTESIQQINALNMVQIDSLPITAHQIQKETSNDFVLNKVLIYLQSGNWPSDVGNDIMPYYRKRNDLSIQDGIIIWGLRVVIPLKYRKRIIDELHNQHPGVNRMKRLSRIHVWYPNIDEDIENCVKSCYECANNKGCPSKAYIHPWSWPTKPYDRVHVDFFTLYGHNYLLLVDSHSKWLEIERMSSTKTSYVTQYLRRLFACFGVPIQLVSDNGPQFTSWEFEQFLKENGVKHIRSSAYHPSSNGGAERFVQTVKKGLVACHIERGDGARKLDNFLYAYRTTPSTVTGKTPSELFLKRQIRSRLDILKPRKLSLETEYDDHDLNERMLKYNEKMQSRVQSRQAIRLFNKFDRVLVRNHVGKRKWNVGHIVKRIADRTYIVKLGHREVKRHIDDIRLYAQGNAGNSENGTETDDDSWMYGGDENRNEIGSRRNARLRAQYPRRYPARERRPTDRFGISNFA